MYVNQSQRKQAGPAIKWHPTKHGGGVGGMLFWPL